MSQRPAKPPGLIRLIPASLKQKSIIENLLQLYAHDFSEFHEIDLKADGRFGYKPLPLYWSQPHRHPFLIKFNGSLAGFALVKRGSEVSRDKAVWDMAEFFVVRRYRRQGVGTHAAHRVWQRFPGAWEVRVMQSNTKAAQFWERAISSFTGTAVKPSLCEKKGERWQLFSFPSNGDEVTKPTYSRVAR